METGVGAPYVIKPAHGNYRQRVSWCFRESHLKTKVHDNLIPLDTSKFLLLQLILDKNVKKKARCMSNLGIQLFKAILIINYILSPSPKKHNVEVRSKHFCAQLDNFDHGEVG